MSNPPTENENLVRVVRQTLQQHWKAFLVQGILLALLGAMAVAIPNVASVAVDVFVGWLLVIVGLARIVSLGTVTDAPGYRVSLLLGLLTTALGALLAIWPAQGVVTLTMALVAYLIAHGVGSILLSLSLGSEVKGWGWILFGGLIDFVLAAIILSGWPRSTAWVLGLLVGLNLLLTGLRLIAAALGARAEEKMQA